MKKVNVVNAKGEVVKAKSAYGEILAQQILNVSSGVRSLLNSGLKEETIVILVHEHCKVGKPDIRAVLRSLPELEHVYLSKKK